MRQRQDCTTCINYKPRPDADGLTHYEMPARSLFPGRRRYEQTAAPAWGARETQAPVSLGAGEIVYRPFSWSHDIAPFLAFSAVYGGFVSIAAVAVAVGIQHPGQWIVCGLVLVVDVAIGAVFTHLRLDVWRREETHPVTQKRAVENAAPQTGGTWRAESVVKAGNTTTIDRPELADPLAWHRFCRAVVNGREFSQSESRRHKVPPSDWQQVFESWSGRGWLVPQGKRKAPRVRAVAMAHIRNYGSTPPTPPTSTG